MSDYLVTDTELTSVANAVRTKGGTQAALSWPDGYVSAIGAIPTGGTKPSYLISDGDTVSAFYFNTAYDLDSFLAGLTYADTDPVTGLDVCWLGIGFFFAVDLTGGEYAVVWNDGTNVVPIYTTSAVPAYGVTAAGWQVASYTPSTSAAIDASYIPASFMSIMDSVIAKDGIAFGSHGGGNQPQLNAPSISISQNTLTIVNPSTNGNFVSGYKILVDGVETYTTSNATYDLSGISGNTETVTVKATGANFADSPVSNSAIFTRYFSVAFYDGATQMTGSPVSVAYGTTVAQAVAAGSINTVKSGYDFSGWYSDSSLTTEVPSSTAISAATVLYGKWTESVYLSLDKLITLSSSGVRDATFSPDGRFLALTMNNDPYIAVYDCSQANAPRVYYTTYGGSGTMASVSRAQWINNTTFAVSAYNVPMKVIQYSNSAFADVSSTYAPSGITATKTKATAVPWSNAYPNANGKILFHPNGGGLFLIDVTTTPFTVLHTFDVAALKLTYASVVLLDDDSIVYYNSTDGKIQHASGASYGTVTDILSTTSGSFLEDTIYRIGGKLYIKDLASPNIQYVYTYANGTFTLTSTITDTETADRREFNVDGYSLVWRSSVSSGNWNDIRVYDANNTLIQEFSEVQTTGFKNIVCPTGTRAVCLKKSDSKLAILTLNPQVPTT